ncbi:unnamed protein product [Schistosoma mattheei]|uniref:Uncharacterized protein n=1 Tax=Schistosoma mattheei TaxID=31246 RepID=A0A3P8FZI6_9TREM|nr:unnamed protein product [Schistosoma mattheei]
MVVAKMKLKLKKKWTTGETALKRFNTGFLKHTDKRQIRNSSQPQVAKKRN